MPTREEILAGLTTIANQGRVVAVAWHVVLAAVLIAVALGWRPRPRTAGALIALLPASVSAFAFAYGNPFNGVVFAGIAIALALLALGDRRGAIDPAPSWTTWSGLAMVAFGWAYPHFLGDDPIGYLVAAPVGLLPCPTLAVAIGLALLADGGGRRAWRLVLAGAGAAAALFGVLRLGVGLDGFLLAGAVTLAATVLTHSHARAPHAAPG